MVLIDTNSLLVLIIGLIDKKQITTHKRTSVFEEEDFETLLTYISDLGKLVVLPNIWTEVDNLLNGFSGDLKWNYVKTLKRVTSQSTEKYLSTFSALERLEFWDLGLTDTLLLQVANQCELLITSDSKLADYAKAMNVNTLDLVEQRNIRLRN